MGFLDDIITFALTALTHQTSRVEKRAEKELNERGRYYDSMSDSQKRAYDSCQEKVDNLKERNQMRREYLDNN